MAVAGSLTYDTSINKKGFENDLKSMSTSTVAFGNIIANVFSKISNVISSSMDKAVSRFDTLNNFPKVMTNLGISAKDSSETIELLSDKLTGIPTTLDDAALAVQRFTSKNGDIKKSAKIFLAVNDAILAGGASTEIQASALEQLSQSYAKGKMDMVEWRSIQTAMPAQLKQVANAMGMSTDALGELIRNSDTGQETMDKFIETIIKLDKEGINGLPNFAKQARNATGGIQTSFTNMKTRIVKGVTDLIDSVDKLLKKENLGGIAGVIETIGIKSKTALEYVGKKLPSIYNQVKKLSPVIKIATATMISFKLAMSISKSIDNTRKAMTLLNKTMMANPYVALATGLTAVGVALYQLGKYSKGANDAEIDRIDTTQKHIETQKKLKEATQQNINNGMQEINHYKALQMELSQLVDENGNVKSGYEARAQFIATTLNNALGSEITITNGVIKNYETLSEKIDKLIAKKKAKIILDAQEKEYEQSIKNQTKLESDLGDAYDRLTKAKKNYNEALKGGDSQEIVVSSSKFQAAQREYEQIANSYAETSSRIKVYEENFANFQAGHYDKMISDTAKYVTTFKGASDKHLKDLQTNLADQKKTLKALKEEAKTNNSEDLQNRIKYYQELIKTTKESVNNEKETIKTANAEKRQQWLNDISAQISDLKGKSVEFRQVGKNQYDMYVNGQNQGLTMSKTQLENYYNEVINKMGGKSIEFNSKGIENINSFNSGLTNQNSLNSAKASLGGYVYQVAESSKNVKGVDWYDNGTQCVRGINKGIENKNEQAKGKNATKQYAKTLFDTFRQYNLIHSPSRLYKKWAKYIPEGVAVGIEANTDSAVNSIKDMSESMYDEMQKSVALETGNLSANAKVKANYSYNNTIVINSTIDGNVEMDRQKVGRLITPVVTQTIKSGGGR